ncbi:hypothetical protein [Microcoleus sp. B5-D4]
MAILKLLEGGEKRVNAGNARKLWGLLDRSPELKDLQTRIQNLLGS